MTSQTTERIPPGWFDDPWNPSGRRWWDGRQWTGFAEDLQPEAGWWLASDGRYYPPLGRPRSAELTRAVAVTATASPPKPGVRKPLYRRVWFWFLLAAVGLTVAIGLWAALILGAWLSVPVGNRFGLDDGFSYEEDFSAGAGRFDVYDERGVSGTVEDEKYLLTTANPESGNRSLVWFFPSSRVDVRATMTLTGGAGGARLGLVLSRGDGGYYQFRMSPDGGAEIVGSDLRCTQTSTSPTNSDLSGELRLVAQRDTGDEARITGYFNDQTLVTCDYTYMADVFTGAGVFVEAGEQPATTTVDDFSLDAFKY